MRGTPSGILLSTRNHRFIPAYAGNASLQCQPAERTAVHPRVCGERIGLPCVVTVDLGSSPRMRGTLSMVDSLSAISRFIPAYAGNAASRATTFNSFSVHPRVCGERRASCPKIRNPDGSSPRMRGTHRRRSSRAPRWRFIPAYAGNASPMASPTRSTTVHPRVCGERPEGRRKSVIQAGSSPRMRGTLALVKERAIGQRFIPAYAGNASGKARSRGGAAVHPRVCGERSTSSIAS